LSQAVRRVCPSWLVSERDDLVQTALIKILERERRTGTQQQLEKAYLYRVAHSVLVDEIRSRRRRKEQPLDEQPDGEREVRTTPETQVASQELGRQIHECMQEIKRERRLALALRLQGYSVSECADRLGWQHKQTENLVHRGMADLRRLLEARGVKP
jgi:RNA polymerase sigma-70 factor (ECF subfamily)